MKSASNFFTNLNYKKLIEKNLTKSPQLNGLTHEQFYKSFETLLSIAATKPVTPIEGNNSYNGYTALTIASYKNLEVLAFRLLENKDIDVKHAGPNGTTALHCAALSGNVTLVKKIISKGASISDANSDKQNAFHFAAMSGNPEVLEYLLTKLDPKELPYEIYEHRDYYDLPLHLACKSGNLRAIELLVNKMDPECLNVTGEDQRTPLYLAAKSGSFEGVQLFVKLLSEKELKAELVNSGPVKNILCAAAKSGNVKVFTLLESKGATYEGNYASDYPSSLLRYAIFSESLDMVKYVLQKYKDTISDFMIRDCEYTPLGDAIQLNNVAIAAALIDYGVDLCQKNLWGKTPLEQAMSHGHQEMIAFLSKKLGVKMESKSESKISTIGKISHDVLKDEDFGIHLDRDHSASVVIRPKK